MRFIFPFILLSSFALADDAPQIPLPGENLKLTQGKNAVDFFSAKVASGTCQKKVAELEKKTEASLTDLNRAKKAGSADTDSLETVWRKNRSQLLSEVESCGPCSTPEVKQTVIKTAARNQVWYEAQGVCQYLGKSPNPEAGFDNALKSLIQVSGYSQRSGGFDPLIDFIPFNLGKKAISSETKEVVPAPFHAFLGMKATEVLGVSVVYQQLVEVSVKEQKSEKGVKEAQIVFKAISLPEGVSYPELNDYTASGKKKFKKHYSVRNVIASWYLNANGYVHYFMAGDFGTSLPFASEAGRNAARDVAYTLLKRFE